MRCVDLTDQESARIADAARYWALQNSRLAASDVEDVAVECGPETVRQRRAGSDIGVVVTLQAEVTTQDGSAAAAELANVASTVPLPPVIIDGNTVVASASSVARSVQPHTEPPVGSPTSAPTPTAAGESDYDDDMGIPFLASCVAGGAFLLMILIICCLRKGNGGPADQKKKKRASSIFETGTYSRDENKNAKGGGRRRGSINPRYTSVANDEPPARAGGVAAMRPDSAAFTVPPPPKNPPPRNHQSELEGQIAAKEAELDEANANRDRPRAKRLMRELEMLEETKSRAAAPSLADQIATKETELDAANAAKDRPLARRLMGELEALEDQAAAQEAGHEVSVAYDTPAGGSVSLQPGLRWDDPRNHRGGFGADTEAGSSIRLVRPPEDQFRMADDGQGLRLASIRRGNPMFSMADNDGQWGAEEEA